MDRYSFGYPTHWNFSKQVLPQVEKSWLSISLQKHKDTPLTFHTLPAPHKDSHQLAPEQPVAPLNVSESIQPVAEMKKETKEPSKPKNTLSPSTTTIPRLISVVEIIKREYIKTLELKHSTRLAGLHQYNEIGCLEQESELDLKSAEGSTSAENTDARRMDALAVALDGKH